MSSLMPAPAPCFYNAAGGYSCARVEPFSTAGDASTQGGRGATDATGSEDSWQPATSATLTLSSKGKTVRTMEVDLPYRQPRSKTVCAVPKWGTLDIQARCPKCSSATGCSVRLGWSGEMDRGAAIRMWPVDSNSTPWNVCRGRVQGVEGVHLGVTEEGSDACRVVVGTTAHLIDRQFETLKLARVERNASDNK
jgi:hypothetical protein